jgi:hypothetical protein
MAAGTIIGTRSRAWLCGDRQKSTSPSTIQQERKRSNRRTSSSNAGRMTTRPSPSTANGLHGAKFQVKSPSGFTAL